MDRRLLLTLAAVLGFLAVALGAFGAHGLPRRLADLPDEERAKRLENWKTASDYLMYHALALGLVASAAAGRPDVWSTGASGSFLLGAALFSGCLFAWCLTGAKPLVHLVPLGGGAFLLGWVLWGVAVWRRAT